MAGELLERTDRHRRLCGRYLRLRFGTEVQATEDDDTRAIVTEFSEGKLRVVGRGDWNPIAALLPVRPERYPRNLGESALYEDLLQRYALAAFTVRAMLEAGWDVKEAGYNDEDMTWVTCQVFLSIIRLRVLFSAASMEQDSGSQPVQRERHTAILAGWVGSKISLKRNKWLSSALADQGERPFDTLLRELPAATIIGWATAGREGPADNLINSVTRSLEKLGREAVISDHKVRDEPLEEAVVTPKESAGGARMTTCLTSS
jgi:hypothetical protein